MKTTRPFFLKSRLFYILSGCLCLLAFAAVFPIVSGLTQKKTAPLVDQPDGGTTVTANLTDNVSVAQNPGGTITYTATITNTGTTDAANMVYNNQISNATTLIGASVNVQPIAANNDYNAAGNVTMVIPDGATDLLSNDTDADGNTITITTGTFTTTGGGSITINANGSFNYAPLRGFAGTDTYLYTISDGTTASNNTATGTISITVSTPIWFVNPAVGADGDGTFASPYKNLSTFSTANVAGTGANPTNPDNGDNIFLYTGAHTGGVTLRANQRVIGQGATASIVTIAGITTPSGTNQLPATGGANPVIASGATTGITLNSGNLIRGLTVGGSTFAIDDNGATVGALTVTEVTVNSAGGGFRADNGGGTIGVTLAGLTSGGGANGINLASVAGGSFAVTGAVTVTNSTADSISLNNNTATFGVGGLTQINTTANNFIGIHLQSGSGAVTFAGIEINGRQDKGIRISGGTRNVTTGAVDIDNSNSDTASAVEITAPTGGTYSFGATAIANNAANGTAIEIQNNCAACPVTFATGSTIAGAGGTDFLVNQGSGNVTFNGTITNTAGGMITVTARTGGTIDFTGNLSHNVAATAISLSGNTGGTIQFTGATKTLNSSTATAVNSTGSGATINFTNGGWTLTRRAARASARRAAERSTSRRERTRTR